MRPSRAFLPDLRRTSFGILFLLCFLFPVRPAGAEDATELEIFVSILPQKTFVKRVAGAHARVYVLVGPGQSPATYEPTPRQMAQLTETEIFFRIGVPFEAVWIRRIKQITPRLQIIDLRDGIEVRSLEEHVHEGPVPSEGDEQDPHVWTSPRNVETMARTIRDALVRQDPENGSDYDRNLQLFLEDLRHLDADIRTTLAGIGRRRFLVFHPAWGYFADAYGLEQAAVRPGGMEPGAKTLAGLIDTAKSSGIRTVFVQKQFSPKQARTIADALGGHLVVLDPLAEDYLGNMRRVADALRKALQ